MNFKLIIFSALVTSVVGSVLGVALAEMAPSPYYKNTHRTYAVVGAVMGLVVGATQETVRELNKQVEIDSDDFN